MWLLRLAISDLQFIFAEELQNIEVEMNTKKIFLLLAIIGFVGTAYAQIIPTAKFGKGVNFMAKDSSMSLKIHFRMQQLLMAEYDGGTEEWSTNFLVRRSRLKFGGFAFSPKLQYKAEIGLSNRDISTSSEDGNGSGASRLILDAVLKYQFQKHWQVWIGQTKLPGNRERVISSANLHFVDRSLLNSKFNIDRDMGVQLHGKYTLGENFIIQPKFALTQGEGRDITSGNHGGLNYTGRVDLLPLGKFEGKKEDYMAADIVRQSKPKLALGFTYNFNQGAVRQQGQLGKFVYDSTGSAYSENDLTALQADLHFKYKGFSIMSEWANTSSAEDIVGTSRKYNTGSAFSIEAGYVLKGSNIEPALRYTTINPDDDTFSGITQTNMLTFGLSKYIVGHNLKIQSDFSYLTYQGVAEADLLYRFQVEMQF